AHKVNPLTQANYLQNLHVVDVQGTCWVYGLNTHCSNVLGNTTYGVENNGGVATFDFFEEFYEIGIWEPDDVYPSLAGQYHYELNDVGFFDYIAPIKMDYPLGAVD